LRPVIKVQAESLSAFPLAFLMGEGE